MGFQGNCKICGEHRYIHKGKCYECHTPEEMADINEKRNRMTKAIREKQLKKQRENKYQNNFVNKKRKIKNTGQVALFTSIWNTRYTVSFIDGSPLHEFNISLFAHVLPKGAYRLWILNSLNIVLMTEEQHWQQHNIPRSELEKRHPGWIKFFELQDKLREEYNKTFKSCSK